MEAYTLHHTQRQGENTNAPQLILTTLIILTVTCATAGTIRLQNYPSGSRQTPWSGTASHLVGVPDGNGGYATDSDSVPVAVSSPGEVSTWSLRYVMAQCNGVTECLPAAMGSVTGAEPPPPPDPWYIKTLKYMFEKTLEHLPGIIRVLLTM